MDNADRCNWAFCISGNAMKQPNYAVALKKTRIKNNIGQRDLGEFLARSQTYISLIERGVTSPTREVMVHICDAMGVTYDEMMEIGGVAGGGVRTPKKSEEARMTPLTVWVKNVALLDFAVRPLEEHNTKYEIVESGKRYALYTEQ